MSVAHTRPAHGTGIAILAVIASTCSEGKPIATADVGCAADAVAGQADVAPWPVRGDCPYGESAWSTGEFWIPEKGSKNQGCTAKSDQDCNWSWNCRYWGYCNKHPDGTCGKPVAEPCASNPMCLKQGDCHWAMGRCQPASQDDCTKAENCKMRGACKFVLASTGFTQCLAVDPTDCTNSIACQEDGDCHVVDGGICRPATVADCVGNDVCKLGGRCAFVDFINNNGGQTQWCGAFGDWECRHSAWCKERGQCTRYEQQCVPANDDDCKNSTWCQTKGLCKMHQFWRRCVKESDFAGSGLP